MNPSLDLAIDGYIHVRPALVVPELRAPDFWSVIDSDLTLRLYHDRGEEGARWYVSGPATGMTGTAELWVEPYREGTLPHLFLRCRTEPPTRRSRRRARRIARTAERHLRAALFEVKDRLESQPSTLFSAYPPMSAHTDGPPLGPMTQDRTGRWTDPETDGFRPSPRYRGTT